MMGTGNLTELTDADTLGMQAVLMGIVSELRITNVLTTQVSPHCRGRGARGRCGPAHDVRRARGGQPAARLRRGAADAAHRASPFPTAATRSRPPPAEIRDPNFRVAGQRGRHPCVQPRRTAHQQRSVRAVSAALAGERRLPCVLHGCGAGAGARSRGSWASAMCRTSRWAGAVPRSAPASRLRKRMRAHDAAAPAPEAESMIHETIVTVRNERRRSHRADGVRDGGEASSIARSGRPPTLDNPARAIRMRATTPTTCGSSPAASPGAANGPPCRPSRSPCNRLAAALAHAELVLERVEEDPQRPRLHCRELCAVTHAPFRGFNRAQAAVIEARSW